MSQSFLILVCVSPNILAFFLMIIECYIRLPWYFFFFTYQVNSRTCTTTIM